MLSLRVCVVFCIIGFSVASEWSYTDPRHWGDFCDGSRQSPINVVTSDETYNSRLGNFFVTGWGSGSYESGQHPKYTLINNGHSLQMNLESQHIHVSGARLSGNYRTAQLHFHWGSDDSQGSEHTIDKRRFPMELHVVNYKETYGSLSEALNYHDGLAVMSFMFRVSSSDNSNYGSFLNYLSDIPNKGDEVVVDAFPIEDLVHSDLDKYHRYSGSLTTPPCSEVVTWSIFQRTVSISEAQLEKFRSLYEDSGAEHLENNYRPIQPLNGRSVQKSWS